MTTALPPNRTGNGLSLLANKCAARTFDISSGMVYASMRDQIVRAQLLIRDLLKCDPSAQQILIVGAGIAGISAAMCAQSLGLKAVVVESKSGPMDLQSRVTKRKVGPFMYEWPSILSSSQSYPPQQDSLGNPIDWTPTWSCTDPMPSHELAMNIVAWHLTLPTGAAYPEFHYNCNADLVKEFVRDFVATHSRLSPASAKVKSPTWSHSGPLGFEPDYIVLAAGMGTERVHLIEGTEDDPTSVKGMPFWEDDDLRDFPEMNWKVGVFGGGDGALQDVLRLITKFDHPLELINEMHTGADAISSDLNDVMPQLEALEQQSRLYATWSSGPVYELIDAECEKICVNLARKSHVVTKVLAQLRAGTGTVFLSHRGNHFGKAYLLNRFCLHLIEKCLPNRRIPGKVAFERIREAEATDANTDKRGNHTVILSNKRKLLLNRVVVRFGPSQDELQKRQLIKLHPETHADRTSMASIPLPFTVAQ